MKVQEAAEQLKREAGKIIDAYRMPFDWWQISENGEIQVKTSETAQFQTTSEGSVILFESQQEGLLSLADDLIKGARDQDAAWQKRVEQCPASTRSWLKLKLTVSIIPCRRNKSTKK